MKRRPTNLDPSVICFFWLKSRPRVEQGVLRNTCLHLSRGVARNRGAADEACASQSGGLALTGGPGGPHLESIHQIVFEGHFITCPGASREVIPFSHDVISLFKLLDQISCRSYFKLFGLIFQSNLDFSVIKVLHPETRIIFSNRRLSMSRLALF